jgi:hypothetical protein
MYFPDLFITKTIINANDEIGQALSLYLFKLKMHIIKTGVTIIHARESFLPFGYTGYLFCGCFQF